MEKNLKCLHLDLSLDKIERLEITKIAMDLGDLNNLDVLDSKGKTYWYGALLKETRKNKDILAEMMPLKREISELRNKLWKLELKLDYFKIEEIRNRL